MERKKRRMLLVILMIITILATDFFVLSSGIKTYATQLNSETDNTNIEFSTYFKEGQKRVDSIEKSIKAEDVRLYAEIKVKNEGYLKEGTAIELENSNFNLKDEILPSNTHIKSIEGNKVNLKQINNGETVEIELGIEPIITDKTTTDFLSKTTTVKMIGVYVYSKAEDGTALRTDKWVCVNYAPDEATGAELETSIITNKVFSLNGTNKRIVQQLIKSRIANNEYPEKQTMLNVNIPNLGGTIPEISATAINGTTKISNITTKDETIEITLSNEADTENQINWNKNFYNEIVVTYIYPETVDASKLEITTNSKIEVYNSSKTYMATHVATNENEELNNVIIGRTEITTEELYKGKLYANIVAQYNTKTSTVITNAEVADKITVHEVADVFGTEAGELVANTKYISTEVNLEKMLEILGQDGNIEIKNGETTNINKDSTVDENGNVVINYENGTAELVITTSKPVSVGILELKHTKAITENNYARAQLQKVKTLNAKGTILATLGETKILENITESAILELKETISKAELTIENNKQTLSTTQPNEVTLGITLITDGTKYDLYKNPRISLKFPTTVKNVELISTPSKQNADEFTVNVGKYNESNKTLQINLQGEQTAYPKSELTQSYIQLNLKVTLEPLALANTDKIMMAYTNENAIQYASGATYGIAEQAVRISAPSQLIKRFNLSSNENTSLTETILQQVKQNEAGKVVNFGISLTNNKDSDISNMKILGKLPTTENKISGQDTNTLETTLKGITAENANIYYTENSSATADINKTSNAWTQDLSTLNNAKLYLIQVDNIKRGETYVADLQVETGTSTGNELSYAQYGVIYDTSSQTGITESSRKIGLATSMAASIKTEIKAQVGQDILEAGDTVKEGEVIKYTVTVSNKGASTLENVGLKLDVPEGTTYVRPIEKYTFNEGTEYEQTYEKGAYVYLDGYYEEITNSEQLAELITINIPQLTTKEPYTIEYEVRVNKGSANTDITNKPTVIYDDTELESFELTNKIQEGNVRVTIKGVDDVFLPVYSGATRRYTVYIENLSSTTISNLEMQIKSSTFNIEKTEKIIIDEIAPNNKTEFLITGTINKNAKEIAISAIVKDENEKIYRSNFLKREMPIAKATIQMASPQNGKSIKEGDIVEYNITAKNTGEIEGTVSVKTEIPSLLQVQYIYINGEIKSQSVNEKEEKYAKTIYNNIYESNNLDINETLQVKIIAKVGYVPDMYHGQVTTTSSTVSALNVLQGCSETISHILKSSKKTNDSVENVISGIAWLDENANGRKDADENVLPDITVKLYDVSTDSYLKDEEDNSIQTLTNYKGEYTFDNIKNGSYLVIFEYDTEKYEPTKQLAENADGTNNSKAILKYMKVNAEKVVVTAIKLNNLAENVFNMNLGLKENTGEMIPEPLPEPERPDEPDKPTDQNNPTNPSNPDNPSNPNKPTDPNNPDNPTKPDEPADTRTISGYAWLDENINGKKEKEEKNIAGIKVRLYNVSTKDYLKDKSGNAIEITTDANGKYVFNDIEKGSYIVVFKYDAEEYKLTAQNSNIVLKKINVNGQQATFALTDTINLQNDVSNINIGLQENLKFDLELNKYISKIIVQTKKETKTYDYNEKVLGKLEIHRKQIQGAQVVLEYTIKIKNNGEIAGYAKNIVDYIPSGLTFSSELNTDWYLSGNNLYTKSLENTELKPGEEKEVKLILTKAMTSENVGLINNRAEIYQDYNKYGESDIDSTPNNQNQNEDDFGTTDVIIQVATGGSTFAYIMLVFVNVILIFVAIRIMIINDIIKIKTKEERR